MHYQLPTAAIEALKAGQKITAIKIVREQQQIGLQQAKQQVDAHLTVSKQLYPALSHPPRGASMGIGWFIWLAVLVIAGYLFWHKMA
jgi:hypothetical protein